MSRNQNGPAIFPISSLNPYHNRSVMKARVQSLHENLPETICLNVPIHFCLIVFPLTTVVIFHSLTCNNNNNNLLAYIAHLSTIQFSNAHYRI